MWKRGVHAPQKKNIEGKTYSSLAGQLQFGDRIYQVLKLLGKGGSGEVYAAKRKGQSFAVKVFFPFYQPRFSLSVQVFDQGTAVVSPTQVEARDKFTRDTSFREDCPRDDLDTHSDSDSPAF
jgi:serine/threonine protein kinase